MRRSRCWLAPALLALLTPACFAAAADPPALTLEAAVELALEGNRELAVATAAAEATTHGVDEARSQRLPRVELLESFSWTTNPVYVFGNLLGQEAFGAANFDPAFLNEPDALTNFQTRLVVRQPLYTGGKIRNGMEAARAGSEAAAAERERTRQQVVHQVLDAYTGAVLADSHLQVAQEALATSAAHVALVTDLREAGLVVESDLLQVRVRRTEIEEIVIRAESAISVSRARLNMILGLPQADDHTLENPCESSPCAAVSDLSLDDLIDEARATRTDLQASALREQAAERMVRLARAARRPEIGAGGMYEANAEDFIGADGTNWSVTAGLRWTLFAAGEARAQVARREAERSMANHASELLAESVELEVRTAFHELAAARKRTERTSLAVELAGAGLRIVEDRYREGLATLVELLDAETALTAARTREVAARRDLLLADAALKLAVGRL